jgi:hypothetical protein
MQGVEESASSDDALVSTDESKSPTRAQRRRQRVKQAIAWIAVIVAGLGGFGLFSWLGLLAVVAVVVWRLRSWPARWIAFPAVVVLPAVGLLAETQRAEYADGLAVGIFFALLAAVVVDLLSPRAAAPRTRPVPRRAETAGRRSRRRLWANAIAARADYLVPGVAAAGAAQTWFREGTYIAFGDVFPFLQGSALLDKAVPVWTTLTHGLGARSSAIVNAPVAVLQRAFEAVGAPGPLFERVFLTCLLVGEAVAIVFLIRTVWPSSRMWARIAGASFFLFNLLGFFNLPGSVQMLAFAILPLLGGLMLRGLATGRARYAYSWAFASLGLAYVAANLPLAATTLVGSMMLAFVVHLARGGSIRILGTFYVRALPLFVLFNLWWIVPEVITLLGTSNLSQIPTSPEDWGWTHARNSFTNLFSLNTAWGWPQTLYYPYADSYLNPLMAVAVYAPAAIAFGCLAFRRRVGGLTVTVLSGVALVLVFVSKGIHEPYAAVNESLLTDVPAMWVLREPASKLLPVVTVIFTLLIVFSVDKAIELVAARRNSVRLWWLDPATGVCIVGLALGLIAWPIFTGDIVADERPVLPGVHISVPEHWEDAAEVLNDRPNESGAVLLLPLSDFYQMPYRWGFYGADAVAPHLIKRPVIVGANIGYIPPSDEAQVAVTRVENGIAANDLATVNWSLKALGIKYVIVRGDIDYGLARVLERPIAPLNDYLHSLFRNDAFRFAGWHGPLTLFEVTRRDAGLVAAWSRVEISDTFDSMLAVARSSMNSAVVSSSEDEWAQEQGTQPQLTVVSADASRYVVEVEDARTPFVLTLNQAYDPGWQLHLESSAEEPPHAVVNGFANGWRIDRTGSYEVVIEFAPEDIARGARILSICCVALTVGWLLAQRLRRTRSATR